MAKTAVSPSGGPGLSLVAVLPGRWFESQLPRRAGSPGRATARGLGAHGIENDRHMPDGGQWRFGGGVPKVLFVKYTFNKTIKILLVVLTMN